MSRPTVVGLRLSLIVLLAGSLLAQVLVPAVAAQVAKTFPEVEYPVGPYSVVGILAIASVQVAMLATWRLVTMVTEDTIFTVRAIRWVDVIIGCGFIATIITVGVPLHLLVTHGGGPGIILLLVAALAGGTAAVLLLVVLRGLLQTAIANRRELDHVI